MGKDIKDMKMGQNIKEITIKVNLVGMDGIPGKMGNHMKVNGKME